MTDLVEGYKAFNKDMTNRYGMLFEEGKSYYAEGPIVFGVKGNGFHFCARLEDTLRYFNAMEEEIRIARVTGLGEKYKVDDFYYDYFDMYVCRCICINKILTREEIITRMLEGYDTSVQRFVSMFSLDEEEINLFRVNYSSNLEIQRAISYYQEQDMLAYSGNYDMEYYRVKLKELIKK